MLEQKTQKELKTTTKWRIPRLSASQVLICAVSAIPGPTRDAYTYLLGSMVFLALGTGDRGDSVDVFLLGFCRVFLRFSRVPRGFLG